MVRGTIKGKELKITCFIDNLSAGGAQRQIVMLSILLQKAGHKVTILTYYPHDFFLNEVVNSGVDYLCINESRLLPRIYKIRQVLNSLKQDVVIAFLKTPTLLAELSSLPCKKWSLIVSERNAYPEEIDKKLLWRRFFHLFANYVVTNSNTNLSLIKKNAPWIKNITTIYNCVDLNQYIPCEKPTNSRKIYILGVGKYANQKNIINLIESISLLLKKAPLLMIQVDWYGDILVNNNNNNNVNYYDIVRNRIIELNLQKYINIHGPEKILKHYQRSTVLVLPSFFEGVPNVVCEAMSCGLPILISNVGDHSNLVEEGLNGYLFNPYSISDMANSLLTFCSLPYGDRMKMSKESRKKAEILFNQNIFIKKYLTIIKKI
jgi:glycosyltransferase involved in cell wall biosynthesis